jgi:hypothetical protein
MTSAPRSYALPLYAVVDRHKVDPESPQISDLTERIRLHFQQAFGIESLEARVVFAEKQPLFVLDNVPESSLPALFALADVQRTRLFRYERTSGEEFQLTPLAVKVED